MISRGVLQLSRSNSAGETLMPNSSSIVIMSWNSPYRVEDLVLVKRQIGICEHLVGIRDRREKLQHFVRESGSHDA